jgi:hypothetical protein
MVHALGQIPAAEASTGCSLCCSEGSGIETLVSEALSPTDFLASGSEAKKADEEVRISPPANSASNRDHARGKEEQSGPPAGRNRMTVV